MFVSSLRLLALLGLVLCVAGFLSAAGSRPQAPHTAKDADICGICHEEIVKTFGRTPHSAIGAAACSACHDAPTDIDHMRTNGGRFYDLRVNAVP
jgi:hypothetical protein